MILRLFLIIYLLVLSGMDVRSRKLPALLLHGGAAFVLICLLAGGLFWLPSSELIRRVMTALLGAIPGLMLYVLSFYSDKIGRGDGMVLMIIGLTENWTFSMSLICTACLGLAVFSGVLMCFRRVNGRTHMPYIPFVTGAYLLIKLYEGSLNLL